MAYDDESKNVEKNLHDSMKDALREDIRGALRALLETKHLYQSLKVEWTKTTATAKYWQAKGRDVSGYMDIGGENGG